MERNRGARKLSHAGFFHRVFRTAVALPVHRLRVFLIRQCINLHFIGNHERGIEAKAEMSDDLIIICLVLVLLHKGFGTGKGNIVDILFDFIRRHAQSVVTDLYGPVFLIQNYVNSGLVIRRKLCFPHHLQLLQLCNRVAPVGNQLPVKNVVVTVKPLLDNRKHVLTVNG